MCLLPSSMQFSTCSSSLTSKDTVVNSCTSFSVLQYLQSSLQKIDSMTQWCHHMTVSPSNTFTTSFTVYFRVYELVKLNLQPGTQKMSGLVKKRKRLLNTISHRFQVTAAVVPKVFADLPLHYISEAK